MKHETKTNNGINNTQTVNRLARERVTFESCGTRAIIGGINLHIERQKHKLDQIAATNIKISLDKRIAFSKQSHGVYVSDEKRSKANISNHSRAQRHNIKVSNTFIENIISCPSRANACRFKNIHVCCKRNKPKQYTNTWQITEVSNSTKRHVHNSRNHATL